MFDVRLHVFFYEMDDVSNVTEKGLSDLVILTLALIIPVISFYPSAYILSLIRCLDLSQFNGDFCHSAISMPYYLILLQYVSHQCLISQRIVEVKSNLKRQNPGILS